MLKKLWMDEGGATLSAELALIGTILVIGVVVGLSALQDAVVTELADLGAAIGSLDQSYSTTDVQGHAASSSGTQFLDAPDFCDLEDDNGAVNSRCIVISGALTAEGGGGNGLD